jgi:HAD superfamily phosphoserine phosphatase-like hydrolase
MDISKRKVFLFDLDGTITADETLPAIASGISLEKEIKELTASTILGTTPFIESFINRVNLLKPYPLSDIKAVLKDIKLHNHLVDFISNNRDICFIVTGNLDCWIDDLTSRVNCKFYSSIGQVKGDKLIKLESILYKATVVKDFKDKGYEVVFVGEGNNDAEAIRLADIGIAFGGVHWPSNSVLQFATHAIFEEKELCRFLKQLL